MPKERINALWIFLIWAIIKPQKDKRDADSSCQLRPGSRVKPSEAGTFLGNNNSLNLNFSFFHFYKQFG